MPIPGQARGLRPLRLLPRGSSLSISLIALSILLESAFRLMVPAGLGFLLDRSFAADLLRTYAVVVAVGLFTSIGAGILRDFFLARLQSRSGRAIRQGMFERLQQLSMSFHARAETDDLLEKFTEDIAAIETAVSMSVSWGLIPLIESLLCTALAFWLDWRVALFFVVMWPWVFLSRRIVAPPSRAAQRRLEQEEARVLGSLQENLRAQPVIRAFSIEQAGVAAFRKRNQALAAHVMRAGMLAAFAERFSESGILLVQILSLLLSCLLASRGLLSMGHVVSLQLLMLMLSNGLLYASECVPALENGKLAWNRIHEDFDDHGVVVDKPDAKILPPLRSAIAVNHVDFGYPGERPILSGVSLQIQKNSYVALVGPSGSGKSTLLRLLMRFYDPLSGAVTIDGHDLRAVTQESLREQTGAVLQENFIFHATLRENLRLGRPDAPEEELVDVAMACGLETFVASLPQGFDTVLGQKGAGIRLSGEVVQRIAIARAVLRNASILLLDEIASSLEPAEEIRIHETLLRVARNRTVISVSHRLSATAGADQIYFFESGRVVESGSHFELMAANGAYAALWRKQAGFFFSPDGRHVDVDAHRLKQLPILERLDENLLAEMAPYFATETFPPGRDIVCQDDPGDKFYIIVRGQVEVWRTEEQTGSRMRMAVLLDGDFFGEITLITGFPRTATVRTRTVCTCISLERGQFNRLFERNPEMIREISEVALRRLRETTGNTAAQATAAASIV